jgi:hypothetical protein
MAAPSAKPLNDLADMASTPTTAPRKTQDLKLGNTTVALATSNVTAIIRLFDYESDETGSDTSNSNEADTPPPKTHCTFAVHTGLTDTPELPVEMRLEVYKHAFPEMDRTVVDKYTGNIALNQLVIIQYAMRKPSSCLDEYLSKDKEHCCLFCPRYRDNMILPRALNSNFARDPAIRNEFMTEYLNHVQFSWDFRRSEYNEYTVQSLPKFLAMLEKGDWISAFKHLRLYIDWKQRPSKIVLKVHEGFVHDALWIGRISSVLHRYKVKCELFFPDI